MISARGLHGASWLLFALGLLLGSWLDETPPRPVEMRAGYRVLRADLHAHTRFSDGVLGPCDVLVHGRRRGLDVLAITEHNTVFPAQLARACSGLVQGSPLVVVGAELTSRDAHVTALGIEQRVDARLPLREAIAEVHRQGGVAIAAHPTKRFWPALEPACAELDGVEVVHPIANRGTSPIGSWAEMVSFAREVCPGKAQVGDSDYHAGPGLGRLHTLVFVDALDADAVVEAVRARRTVTFAPDGQAFGDALLIAALEAEPLVARGERFDLVAYGPWDHVSRVFGLLGLLGMLLIRPRARVT